MHRFINRTRKIHFVKRIGQILGRRRKKYLHQNMPGPFCVSDNFIWRMDGNFETAIRISHLAKLFNGSPADLRFVFYDKQGHEIAQKVMPLESVGIDVRASDFLDPSAHQGSHGYFNAFFIPRGTVNEDFQLMNRCYVGYGIEESFFSFVHGNQYGKVMDLSATRKGEASVNILYKATRRFVYQIQRDYSEFDKVEIALVNPFNCIIKVQVNDASVTLEGLNCLLLPTQPDDNGKITLSSNVEGIRPIAFAYKGDFFDVHHC